VTKYKPTRIKSRSWEDIESWYLELIEDGLNYEPLLDLVKHIKNTSLDKRLLAYTSMHKLVIGIYDEIEWDREALHIEFDIGTKKWFFKYRSKPNQPIAFDRIYNEDLGIEKFEQFIKYIKW